MPKITDYPADTAPAGSDVIPFVDVSAGATEKVTVDNLAASTAFGGRYGSLLAPLWVGADAMSASYGAPSATHVAETAIYWVFPDAATRSASGSCRIPPGVSTVNLAIVWLNTTTSAGNVAFRLDYATWTAGDVVGRVVGTPTYVAAATVINEAKVSTIISGLSVTEGKQLSFAVVRDATDPSDTLSQTIGLLGVLVTPT